ncbi:hypothetical protein ACQEU5_21000 [Marinactinospora thermotolerans]|uniref:Uncharacterized protein n=1 Tax=Marinactinospora thermotolerans DSM 45154 TaxID=1122192 RepID=A0A1T4PLA6_9ACTN|nr:hypothetical protein [Marinactinospora thermotolerans]SJZ92036.1 hypothetical protein SAMN02745673_01862 [Marinactinospora thermotolerans DSM 45154]
MTSRSETGRWWGDRLVGPGATGAEYLLCAFAVAAGTLFALVAGIRAGLPAIPLAVTALLAVDLYGGAVANATRAAKRHWHRPGRTARHHLAFVAAHLHPFVLAWAVPGVGWATATLVYGMIVAGALAVLIAPPALRRPVAFAAAVLVPVAVAALAPPPAELAWFAPVLAVKLLPGHLLAEEAGT